MRQSGWWWRRDRAETKTFTFTFPYNIDFTEQDKHNNHFSNIISRHHIFSYISPLEI